MNIKTNIQYLKEIRSALAANKKWAAEVKKLNKVIQNLERIDSTSNGKKEKLTQQDIAKHATAAAQWINLFLELFR